MNIIIILLLLKLLIGKKSDSGYLYCGLFGWSGKNPLNFNRHAFSILGISNQDRGKDSCGIYTRDAITYGIHASSNFSSLIKRIPPVSSGKNCVVMGHTRKASIGVVNAENAQPVAITNDDDKLKFVLTHNGTLENHLELAKKYSISVKNLNTDTQVLAALIYHTEVGFNILAEYEGTAALAFNWTGDDSIYLFKGESKNSSNTHYLSEERPLYIYQESKHSLYYSSDKNALELIAKNNDDIVDIKCNTLFRIHEGEIQEVMEIDRNKRYQRYVVPYVKPTNAPNMYDGSFESWGGDNRAPWTRRNSIPTSEPQYIRPAASITSEVLTHMGQNMLVYTRGRYHQGANLIHGKVTVNEIGVIQSNPDMYDIDNQKFNLYFYEGILLFGQDEFEEIIKIREHKHTFIPTDIALLNRSPYPIANYDPKIKGKGINRFFVADDTLDYATIFEGRLAPVLCNRSYQIIDGLMAKITRNTIIKKIESDKIDRLTYW